MPKVSTFDEGQFCWVDLATNDAEGAIAFYTGLFGWEARTQGADGSAAYTAFHLQGEPVAACFPREPGTQLPSMWNTYIAVADADRAAKSAEEHGATILRPATDMMDAGRVAVIADPTGAPISFWQSKGDQGFGIIDEPGARVWNELSSPSPEKAAAFYTDLFGYDVETMPSPSGPYTTLSIDGKPWAGIIKPGEDWGMPPTWVIYFGSADAEATAAKCIELGGSVPLEATKVEGVGVVAWLADPQGAVFAILQAE